MMKGACLQFPNPITDAISRVRFAPRSNKLLISSWDSALRLYDIDSSELKLGALSEAALLDCCFQDESAALSAGSDGVIRRYDLNSGAHDSIGKHCDIATCVEYVAQLGQVITAGLDKKMMSWDTRIGKAPASSKYLGGEADSMSLSGFDLMVAVGTSVVIFDLRNLDRPLQLKEPRVVSRIKCISSVPYSKGFAVGSVDGRVALEIFDSCNTNDTGYSYRCHPKSVDGRYHLVSVNDIVFNPRVGGIFVTGDNEGHVIVWDVRNRRRVSELPRCPNSVASLSYSHDGRSLAVVSSYTYHEANEIEEPPQVFVYEIEDANGR